MAEQHAHNFYELLLITQGGCKIFMQAHLFYLHPGDLIIIPPHTLHRTAYQSEQINERWNLSFSADLTAALLSDELMTRLSRDVLRLPAAVQDGLDTRLNRIQQESARTDEFSVPILRALTAEFLLNLARFQTALRYDEPLHSSAEQSMERCAAYISAHYAENIRLSDLSAFSGMSDGHFSRSFKKATGFGFREYMTQVRLSHARRLLLETQKPITEIAALCGFSDSNYFGDAFRRETGYSPRAFRKQSGIGLAD